MSTPKVRTQRVSRYEPLRQIGQGSLTRVYLAALRDEGQLPELFALKLLRKELAKDDDFRALFLEQAGASLELRHPNLVLTHDVVADSEACGLAQEFLEGKTLAQLIERLAPAPSSNATQPGGLPLLHLRVRVLCQVLDALHYVHHLPSHGEVAAVVHRDVAPHSIIVTYEGRVKLLGTGFAQARRDLEGKLGTLTADIGYAAPELLLGYSAGPSADLYGVGVMLWEAVAGRRRVFGKTRELTIRQRTSGEEPDVEQACPGAPPALADICRRALRVSPRHRYATAMEFRHDLVSYLTSAGSDDETSLAPSLAKLMHGSFAAELAEMQLFIDSSLDNAEGRLVSSPGMRSSAEPPLAVDDDGDDETHIVASEIGTEEAWIDETHVVASDVDRASDVEPMDEEVSNETYLVAHERGSSGPFEAVQPSGPSAVDVAAEPNPKRDSDTGGHRAFSTSLAQQAVTSSSQSRWAVAGSVALLVLVGIVSVRRMSREYQSASANDVFERRLPARVPAHSLGAEVPRPNNDTDTSAGSGSPDAGSVPEPAPTPAFLEAAPHGFVPRRASGSVTEPQQGILPSDLPLVDEDRDLLEQAIVAADATRPRASRFGRGPRDKRPAKAAGEGTSQSSPAVPRTIDETGPYEQRADP